MEKIRPPTVHVVMMDGTFASLMQGMRSSLGRIHGLLSGQYGKLPSAGRVTLHYAAGQQWDRWRTATDLMMGRALEARITTAYGWLASQYRPGDTIFLLGYSRGAFAVRSLAGMIDRVGLLHADAATERNIRLGWRLYSDGGSDKAQAVYRRRCHPSTPIRMVGCFDTVMALGIRLPILWALTEPQFRFHDARLGAGVEHGFHALALDETRAAFMPLLWDDESACPHIEQCWFRGAHPDIGGQLNGLEFARPLANFPLVWMLQNAERIGLPLPEGWMQHFPCDATAPSIGSWRKWGKAFLARRARQVGRETNEVIHASVPRPYTGPAVLTDDLTRGDRTDRDFADLDRADGDLGNGGDFIGQPGQARPAQ